MKRLGWGIFGAVSFVFVTHFAAGCVGDDPTPTAGGGNDGGNVITGAQLGATCGGGGDCASGNCVDGVCCDSACSGTCETCKLPGKEGTCSPIPDGEDPDNECPTNPLPDAGDTTVVDDGGNGDGGDAAAADAAPTFNYPDGGVASDDKQCAGKCNGQRACAYPDAKKTCGSVFCGNITTQGRAQCDGKGHCLVGSEDCKTFACPDGTAGCKSTCTSEADCAAGNYCDANTNTCKSKVANASACTTAIQCQSGYCKDNVCCNDGCDIPNGTCAKPGYVGQCVCSACPGGTCALWYKDEDGDLHGDMYGTVQNGGAVYGCEAGPAPTIGAHPAVANKDDCYDKNDAVGSLIHPGQNGWFKDSYTPILGGNPSWDYNCDGARQAEIPEAYGSVTGSICGVCAKSSGGIIGCTKYSTCSSTNVTNNVQGTIDCHGTGVFIGSCGGSTYGFLSTVQCGSTGTEYSCQTCTTASQAPGYTYTNGVVQRCH